VHGLGGVQEDGGATRAGQRRRDLLADRRKNAVVLGPCLGVGSPARRLTLSAVEAGKLCLLDADALTSFAEDPKELWRAAGNLVLTDAANLTVAGPLVARV